MPPERFHCAPLNDGTLDRFGAIDPSEGGKTLRSTARLNYHYDTTSGGQFFSQCVWAVLSASTCSRILRSFSTILLMKRRHPAIRSAGDVWR